LRQISSAEILKARLQVESLKMKSRGFSDEQLDLLKERIISAQTRMKKLRDDYDRLRHEFHDASVAKLEQIRNEMQDAQLE
ncbi:hypothetical protein KK470_30105, partial [Klebsiella pneumoniae]|uniref:hypothetical protein n=1 Tax=Klebsiella pneumoniae TaxID=573 RepID=UPI001BE0ECEB